MAFLILMIFLPLLSFFSFYSFYTCAPYPAITPQHSTIIISHLATARHQSPHLPTMQALTFQVFFHRVAVDDAVIYKDEAELKVPWRYRKRTWFLLWLVLWLLGITVYDILRLVWSLFLIHCHLFVGSLLPAIFWRISGRGLRLSISSRYVL